MKKKEDPIIEILWSLLKLLFKLIFRATSVLMWVLFGIFVLPIFFISNSIYPLWDKWGENI
jgi:hypothetical protein